MGRMLRGRDGEIALNRIVPIEQGIAPRIAARLEGEMHRAHGLRAHTYDAGRDSFRNLKLCPAKPLHDGKRCGATLYDEFGWTHTFYQGEDHLRHLGATAKCSFGRVATGVWNVENERIEC